MTQHVYQKPRPRPFGSQFRHHHRLTHRPGVTATAPAMPWNAQPPALLRPELTLRLTLSAAPRTLCRRVVLGTYLLRLVTAIAQWQQTIRERRELRQLSDHVLHDIGVTREQVGSDIVRPFSWLD